MTVLTLQGEISERFVGVEVGRRLRGRVVIDLAQVDRITSFGVREWLTMLRELYTTEVSFARCSEPFMHQLSMIRAFAGNATIESFFAPYVCPCCGTQFSALYDAIEDRPAVQHRVPVAADCPRCDAPATFDDDPALYLSVEHHLVRERDPEIAHALQQLDQLLSVPIRKAVVGEETWITVSTRLDEQLRLYRALQGLEGTVVFDLSAVSAVTPIGIARFLDRIRALGPEVLDIKLVGCPYDLLVTLLAHRREGHIDGRVRVWSTHVSARCLGSGTRRWVLLDLRSPSNATALRRGLTPHVANDWCEGPLDVSEAIPTLRQTLDVFSDAPAQPSPSMSTSMSMSSMSSMPIAPARPSMPLDVHVNSLSSMGSAPRARHTHPQVANAYAQAETVPFRASAVIIGLVCLAVGVLVGTAGLMGGMLLVALDGQADLSGEPGSGSWEGAPSWVATPFLRSAQGLTLVGTARASSLSEGIDLARENMQDVLLANLAAAVRQRGRFELDLPGPGALSGDQRAAAVQALQRLGIKGPARIDETVERSAWGVHVASRYSLSETDWSRASEYFAETLSFRGITVGRVFPTLAPRVGTDASLVVVATPPWMRDAQPGDAVVAVGERRVSDLVSLQSELERAWDAAMPGDIVEVMLRRNGQRRPVEFKKPL